MNGDQRGFTPLEIATNGRKRKFLTGFTLIELIIVIVIIGILAVIAAPMIGNSKVKAICSEGVTGLGVIRQAFMAYKTEYQAYPDIYSQWLPDIDPKVLDALGLSGGKLNGRYFSDNCYLLWSTTYLPGGYYWLYVWVYPDPTKYSGSANTSQGGLSGETQKIADNPALESYLRMDDNPGVKAKIIQYNISNSGYPTD